MHGGFVFKFHILYLWSGDGLAINRVCISGVYYIGRWNFNLNFAARELYCTGMMMMLLLCALLVNVGECDKVILLQGGLEGCFRNRSRFYRTRCRHCAWGVSNVSESGLPYPLDPSSPRCCGPILLGGGCSGIFSFRQWAGGRQPAAIDEAIVGIRPPPMAPPQLILSPAG